MLLCNESPADPGAASVMDQCKRILSVGKLDEAAPSVRAQMDVIPTGAQPSHQTK